MFIKTFVIPGRRLNKIPLMKRKPLVICVQDIQLITGRSESYARTILRAIKKSLGKRKHQFVTFKEFSEFSGISINDLEEHLR